jgi:copper(I)-binding protein
MKRLVTLGLILVVLLAACGGGNEEMNGTDAGGELTVENVLGNLALPMPNGAVYMTITNGTESDDALIDAAVPGCGTVELHEMVMEDDVMVMRQMEGNRIPVPAGETVMLQRGGLHVMCIGKSADFAVGEMVPVTLTFENAGTMEVTAEVLDPAEMEMAPEMEMEKEEGGMDMGGDE